MSSEMIDDTIKKEKADEEMIEKAFQELLDSYLATKHRKKVDIITKAFNFANQAHKGIKRQSGEPYIMHPLAVARIVCDEVGLGSTSICSALLHDVVEDTDYTVEDIENIFGPKIAQIVDGLTKISGGIFADKASSGQAENFKKLLLTMSSDIRVILIKIADRLHNMRTLGSLAPNKQYKIAGETIYIYAPLANRLGLHKIKTELENLSFKYEHPEEYRQIELKLLATSAEREEAYRTFTAPIRVELDKMGMKYRILARVKSIYSIWNKMQTKHVPFEEIYDLLAVRIIFDPQNPEEELNDCFDIYVSISKIYKPHPDRLRDWVSHPKSNGYQALHVTLMGTNGQWVEVQIRSDRMNDVAEQGFAAHWKYKEGGGGEDEGELEKWLKTIKEILDDPQPDAMDFLDTIKMNLFASEIFVFTPKGEIRTMPQDSTVLDFAFSLHTDVGRHCIGAKVNHKLVPISHKLESGDQVEILTSKSQRVQPEWLIFTTTAKAHSKISAILKKEQRVNIKKGETILNEFLLKEGLRPETSKIDRLLQANNLQTREEFLVALGNGAIMLSDDDKRLLKEKQTNNWKKFLGFSLGQSSKDNKEHKVTAEEIAAEKEKINLKKVLKITDSALKSDVLTLASCCLPIPGDDVLGYLDNDRRVILHKRQCPVAVKLKSSYGNRILATEWDVHEMLPFTVIIYIKGIDGLGIMSDVTNVISRKLNVNIKKLHMESNDGLFESKLQLSVRDVNDVKNIMSHLLKIPNIKSVSRVEE